MNKETPIETCRPALTELLGLWAETLEDPPGTTIYVDLIWSMGRLGAFTKRPDRDGNLPPEIRARLKEKILAQIERPERGSSLTIKITVPAVSAHRRLKAAAELAGPATAWTRP